MFMCMIKGLVRGNFYSTGNIRAYIRSTKGLHSPTTEGFAAGKAARKPTETYGLRGGLVVS